MTNHSQHQTAIAVGVLALAAVTFAGCALTTGSTATPAAPQPAAPVTATVTTVALTPAPPVTVTVAAPPPSTTFVQAAASSGPFRSPSGNIGCTMYQWDGRTVAECEVADHSWASPAKEPGCHLNWGSRLHLGTDSGALFACYGQELPPPDHTLGHGQSQSLGTITCDSESAGMTCTDTSIGHYFFISRDTWHLG